MLSWIRTKFGPLVVGAIIGLIAFVFVASDLLNPRTSQGMGGGAIAAEVNGEKITLGEFNREYNRRLEFFKNMAGGKVTAEQLKQFRLKEGVLNELVQRKLMSQSAAKWGVEVSDEELKDRIKEIPAFMKEVAGVKTFDPLLYKQVLEANKYSPGTFEQMMREDLRLQAWNQFFKGRAKVSDEEVKREFLVNNDKRSLRYVYIDHEHAKKGVQISDADVEKYLKDASRVNVVKNQYEMKKMTVFKGKKLEDVQKEIARGLLASEKVDLIRKEMDRVADLALPLLTAEKSSDARVKEALKSFGIEVKSTGLVSRTSKYLPGVGEAGDVLADAFAEKSPIDPALGGKPKKYSTAGWVMIAVVSETQKPDLAKLDAEKVQIRTQLESKKERELQSAYLKQASDKAKIVKNPAVVSDDEAQEGGS